MKKVFVAAVAAAVLLAGCASNKAGNNASALGGAQQAEAKGLPRWASYGTTFMSDEAEGYIPGYTPTDTGFFAEGDAKRNDLRSSQIAARLAARANLASYVQAEIGAYASDNGLSTEEVRVEEIDQILTGSRIVDSVNGDDGTVYILMFISDKNLKKSAETKPTLKDLVAGLAAQRLGELSEESAQDSD